MGGLEILKLGMILAGGKRGRQMGGRRIPNTGATAVNAPFMARLRFACGVFSGGFGEDKGLKNFYLFFIRKEDEV